MRRAIGRAYPAGPGPFHHPAPRPPQRADSPAWRPLWRSTAAAADQGVGARRGGDDAGPAAAGADAVPAAARAVRQDPAGPRRPAAHGGPGHRRDARHDPARGGGGHPALRDPRRARAAGSTPTCVAEWSGFDARAALADAFGVPALVLNDAEVHGAGVVAGTGLRAGADPRHRAGQRALRRRRARPAPGAVARAGALGHHLRHVRRASRSGGGSATRFWSRRIRQVVDGLRPVFRWDRLYLGGGNSRLIRPEQLARMGDDVVVVPNTAGHRRRGPRLGPAQGKDAGLTGLGAGACGAAGPVRRRRPGPADFVAGTLAFGAVLCQRRNR